MVASRRGRTPGARNKDLLQMVRQSEPVVSRGTCVTIGCPTVGELADGLCQQCWDREANKAVQDEAWRRKKAARRQGRR